MTEVPDDDPAEVELYGMIEAEEWCRSVVSYLAMKTNVDADTSLRAARWAYMWYEDFTLLMGEGDWAWEDIRSSVEAARPTSLMRATALPCDIQGQPTAEAVRAGHEAFCIIMGGMGSTTDRMRQLLTEIDIY